MSRVFYSIFSAPYEKLNKRRRNAGYAKEAGFGVALGSLMNILLDPLFMFVILPEGKEVLGAGNLKRMKAVWSLNGLTWSQLVADAVNAIVSQTVFFRVSVAMGSSGPQ